MTDEMKTFLPPEEPPIGSIVVDGDNEQWVRGKADWHRISGGEPKGASWNWLVCYRTTPEKPLTLTQAPFPKTPIVEAEGILWFRDTEGYFALDGRGRNDRNKPFRGIVTPVTVVPTAEWETFVNEVDYDTRGYPSVDVREKAKKLVDAADELEINQ